MTEMAGCADRQLVIGEQDGNVAAFVDTADDGNRLDFYAVLANDAGPGLHGGEGSGGTGGVFYEEEGDGFAVGREGRLLEEAGEVGELADFAGGAGVEEDLFLAGLFFLAGAGGGEGESLGIGAPDGGAVGAGSGAVGGDEFLFGGVGV